MRTGKVFFWLVGWKKRTTKHISDKTITWIPCEPVISWFFNIFSPSNIQCWPKTATRAGSKGLCLHKPWKALIGAVFMAWCKLFWYFHMTLPPTNPLKFNCTVADIIVSEIVHSFSRNCHSFLTDKYLNIFYGFGYFTKPHHMLPVVNAYKNHGNLSFVEKDWTGINQFVCHVKSCIRHW